MAIMRIGFTVISNSHGIEVNIFNPYHDQASSLVSTYQADDLCVVLIGRLYYRHDLMAHVASRVSGAFSQEIVSNDAALALASYFIFGQSGLTRLEGDFSLVLWDMKQKCFLGMRDPLGNYPLFWLKSAEVRAISTSIKDLLRFLPQNTLNLEYIADYLMLPSTNISEINSTQCVFEGINRIAPATLLNLSLTNGATIHKYWDWLEKIEDPRSQSLGALGEQFRELLRNAVRERIHGTTASHLSGGMDSTSVSLIARGWINDDTGKPPLHTLSLIYEKMSSLSRETKYIQSIVAQHEDIQSHLVPADELLEFNSFLNPPFHEEPFPALRCLAAEQAMVRVAAAMGIQTILTGAGADELQELLPFHITDNLRDGQLRTAWREAARWAEAYNTSCWRIFWEYGLINLLPSWVRNGPFTILRRGYASWQKQNSHTIVPWIKPWFARRYGLRGRGLNNIERTYFACRPLGLAIALSGINDCVGDGYQWCLATPQGMSMPRPFLDPRILRFSLGVRRAQLKPIPGSLKPILMEATRGILPEEIRTRHRKANFDETYFLGLSRNLPMLDSLVRQDSIRELDLFNPETLSNCLQQAALGVSGNALSTDRLAVTLSLLKWLSMQQEWQRIKEAPTQTLRWLPT